MCLLLQGLEQMRPGCRHTAISNYEPKEAVDAVEPEAQFCIHAYSLWQKGSSGHFMQQRQTTSTAFDLLWIVHIEQSTPLSAAVGSQQGTYTLRGPHDLACMHAVFDSKP